MEDKQKQSDVPSLDLQHGSGSMLATARKKQQKTIKEIADELNLSVTQVKLIELDQTDGLPEPTYVRGYIRGYAKLLGLNPDEVLQNYLNP
ncbi:MAG: cytoskeleton protein RodZ, partial [Dinoroseobacter sp.]